MKMAGVLRGSCASYGTSPSTDSTEVTQREYRSAMCGSVQAAHGLARLSLAKIAVGGGAVQEYQTRLSSRGALSLLTVERYFSDAEAIDAAKNLRKDGQRIEIWRDDVCVYTETAR
jgi:hypothetical protein